MRRDDDGRALTFRTRPSLLHLSQIEERNLLSVGYKNVIGARRASWRILSSIEDKERAKSNDAHAASIKSYRAKVEKELNDICEEILQILDAHLIVEQTSDESKVFYYKMKGDYYRYLAEFLQGDDRAGVRLGGEAYAEATKMRAQSAEKVCPRRIPSVGLALNFSVFHFEIQNKPQEACALASRRSTTPSPSSTPSARSPPRIPPSSCSCSAITSPCGLPTSPTPKTAETAGTITRRGNTHERGMRGG